MHRQAAQTYSALLGIRLANSNSMTDDLDLAQFASISIAIGDAIDIPLLQILRGVGPEIHAIPDIFASERVAALRETPDAFKA